MPSPLCSAGPYRIWVIADVFIGTDGMEYRLAERENSLNPAWPAAVAWGRTRYFGQTKGHACRQARETFLLSKP